MDEQELQPDTVAIRAGRDDNDTALAPILWASTTFATPSVDENFKMATGARATKFYSRYGNPSVKAFAPDDAVLELFEAEARHDRSPVRAVAGEIDPVERRQERRGLLG